MWTLVIEKLCEEVKELKNVASGANSTTRSISLATIGENLASEIIGFTSIAQFDFPKSSRISWI